MNDQRLRRILRSVLLSAPLPLALLGAACGGSSAGDFSADGGSSGKSQGGAAGTPSAGAGGASTAGSAGSASAGAGGASAGAGGAGSSGSAGVAGVGGGVPDECKSNHPDSFCSPFSTTIPKTCLPAESQGGTVLTTTVCQAVCDPGHPVCSVTAMNDGTVTLLCNPGCAIGRRPAGLCEPEAISGNALGEYFAQIAHLEAASVTAFRVLRDELRAKGAPKKLVRAAARAARDEVRHTRSTGALARRFGGKPPRASIDRGPQRSLEAMAIENAVEGCVRETYGALLATRQAEQARHPGVRAAMQRIARDETRHAALSWSVGRWLETRLDPGARENVARAKRGAARELCAALAAESVCAFADLAGLPSPDEALRLADEMRSMLWS